MTQKAQTFQDLDKLPTAVPHNIDAENAVIGAVIIGGNETYQECSLNLINGAEEFYIHRNRYIWQCCESLSIAGTPIDLLTLSSELERTGNLSDVGGSAYLTSMVGNVPSYTNAKAYAEIVHQKYIRRCLIQAANQGASAAYNEEISLEQAGNEAIHAVTKAISLTGQKNFISIHDSVIAVDKKVEANSQLEELPGIPTPWTDYNKLLGGGIQISDLNLIAGRPGKGKTTALLQIALHAAKYGEGMRQKKKHVVFFTLEMPHEQLTMRLIAQMSRIDFQVLRSGRIPDEKYEKYLEALDILSNLSIYIDSKSAASPAYIRARCEQRAAVGKLDLVCVDSLDRMKMGNAFKGRDFSETDECAQGLKNIALDFSVPVWCAHQLNRNMEKRGDDSRPQLSDLRDGGEQPVDGAMFIWHEMDREKIKSSWFIQEKHRNGPTGEIPVTFLPEYTRFENYAKY